MTTPSEMSCNKTRNFLLSLYMARQFRDFRVSCFSSKRFRSSTYFWSSEHLKKKVLQKHETGTKLMFLVQVQSSSGYISYRSTSLLKGQLTFRIIDKNLLTEFIERAAGFLVSSWDRCGPWRSRSQTGSSFYVASEIRFGSAMKHRFNSTNTAGHTNADVPVPLPNTEVKD